MSHNGREVSAFCIPGFYRNFFGSFLQGFGPDLVIFLCSPRRSVLLLKVGNGVYEWMFLLGTFLLDLQRAVRSFFFFFFQNCFFVHVLLRVFRTRTVWSQLEVFSSLSLSLPFREDLVSSCAASRHWRVECLWEENLEILIIYSTGFSARFRLGGIELNRAVSRIEISSGKGLKRAAICRTLRMFNSCSLFRIVHLLETTETLQLQVCFSWRKRHCQENVGVFLLEIESVKLCTVMKQFQRESANFTPRHFFLSVRYQSPSSTVLHAEAVQLSSVFRISVETWVASWNVLHLRKLTFCNSRSHPVATEAS
jgi:hypothetical protein